MLTQNFKTAAELDIAEVEVDALIKVLGMLERREIKPEMFDMRMYRQSPDACGTVHCICGWANSVSDGTAFPEASVSESEAIRTTNVLVQRNNVPLVELFGINRIGNGRIRTNHAAAALRSYLTTGDPHWDDVLSS